MRRVAFIGDVHGCLLEVRSLVEKLRGMGVQEVWTAGDLVDKGPHPEETVRWLRENGVRSVLGNHDLGCAENWKSWKRRGHHTTKNPDKIRTLENISEETAEYLKTLPDMAFFDDLGVILVHGGLFPKIPFHAQPRQKIVRLIMVHSDHPGKTERTHKRSDGETEATLREKGWRPWWELWDHPYTVVYGHSTCESPRVRMSDAGGLTIGLDTGCVYGGFLTALVLPDYFFVSVPALMRYVDPKR